jgi:hypothetical protein
VAHSYNPSIWKVEIEGCKIVKKSVRPNSKDKPKPDVSSSHLKSQLLGRLRSKGLWFKDQPGKKFLRPHLNGKKLSVVACTYHLNDGQNLIIGGL